MYRHLRIPLTSALTLGLLLFSGCSVDRSEGPTGPQGALLYMDVRYEGGCHGITGYAEPDLILTDDLGLIEASNTGSNEAVAYMGRLTDLLQWNTDDPVDDKERARNDAVYVVQGNRNPFIDHPEWVDCLFEDQCAGGPGDIPGTDSAVIDADGVAELTSPKTAKPTISFTFCVNGVSGAGLSYDAGANVETGDSH